ncbi:conserved hypothetical protein [Verticillium alfalfae VaMs.102]|uniref:Glycosyl transferase 64 domain-containing protein n=1 Tax=Verticillium alfalfae (strain VaMs.102 / ATCC MYA-4576 / FGSC 10136) TaxID=526221 RepID=C9SU28_VERA1|nr:conserved hypothetical protein [Verticillium alfalfae VaMs.102]EEY22339.1 conserved hypothetical protein [Verticillium alfalfae VaMs.102]
MSKLNLNTAAVESYLGNRRIQKIVTIVFAIGLTAVFGLFLSLHGAPSTARIKEIAKTINDKAHGGHKGPRIAACHADDNSDTLNHTLADAFLNATDVKYAHLRDDKFTIAMQTYRRPKELNETLHVLLKDPIPSLHEIVIIWNNLDQAPPQNYTSAHGVPVRYRASPRNSLNQKLLPDPSFATQAVLLFDDSDVYYYPRDLEFAFQAWRRFGRRGLTGAMGRCTGVGKNGEWQYRMCARGADAYSMIITNLAFVHVALPPSTTRPTTPPWPWIREHVDDNLNCEDIAMNYVTPDADARAPGCSSGAHKAFFQRPKPAPGNQKGPRPTFGRPAALCIQ